MKVSSLEFLKILKFENFSPDKVPRRGKVTIENSERMFFGRYSANCTYLGLTQKYLQEFLPKTCRF